MVNARAVIGLNFGDEGKGLVTDYLAHEAMKKYGRCLVVCNNGGAQRSHTVELEDGTRHAFKHFGSGTFAGADTYLSEFFILNPMIFRQEYELLSKKGYPPLVFIDKRCRISTPYEMMLNQALEESRGDQRHGSCGYGIWETVQRYEENRALWRFEDFFRHYKTPSFLDEFRKRNDVFNAKLHEHIASETITCNAIAEWQWLMQDIRILNHFVDDVKFMLSHSVMADAEIINKYPAVIFENGQGLLLNSDPDNVHTTPSNTGMENIIKIEESLGGSFVTRPVYVTRSYMTRHGAGSFETEMDLKDIGGHIEKDITNVPNSFQGSLRYGVLDHDIVNRARKDANRDLTLLITHVNELRPPEYFIDSALGDTSVNGILVSNNPTRQMFKLEDE